jgi:hypothetical protein
VRGILTEPAAMQQSDEAYIVTTVTVQ